jgi:imidazolonepropionase-like amidohydrolase
MSVVGWNGGSSRSERRRSPWWIAVAISALLPSALLLAAACAPASHSLVIRNVTVIDGTGGPPVANSTVVIEGDRITAVGTDPPHTPAATIVDGTGRYLIPGLWDMHVHLRDLDGALALYPLHGVTTVRDMGSNLEATRALQEDVRHGSQVGPRIFTPGPVLESGPWMKQYVELLREADAGDQIESFLGGRISIDGPADAAGAVRSLASRGVDFLKIRHAASLETFLAIARAAKQEGLELVGHYTWVVSLVETADAGQRSVEHNILPGFTDLPAADKQEIWQALARNRTHLVPTLVAGEAQARGLGYMAILIEDEVGLVDWRNRYVSHAIRKSWRESHELDSRDQERPPDEVIQQMVAGSNQFLRQAHLAGVPVMAGTDTPTRGTFMGSSLHDELELLVAILGLTTSQALQSATSIPARFMGREQDLGTIAVGRIADLVILDADPLADISNSRRIHAVISGGRLIDVVERRRLLAKIEGALATSGS